MAEKGEKGEKKKNGMCVYVCVRERERNRERERKRQRERAREVSEDVGVEARPKEKKTPSVSFCRC